MSFLYVFQFGGLWKAGGVGVGEGVGLRVRVGVGVGAGKTVVVSGVAGAGEGPLEPPRERVIANCRYIKTAAATAKMTVRSTNLVLALMLGYIVEQKADCLALSHQ